MTDPAKVSLTKVGYVILYVKDVEKAAAFYRDQLGIPVPRIDAEWTELGTEGTTIALHRCDEAPPFHHPALPDVVFNVEDVRGTHAALKERGVKIHDPKVVWGGGGVVGVAAELHDPDGNRLSIHGTIPEDEWKASQG